LSLCNCVFGLDDRQDSLLLDGGWFLETKGVDAAQDFLLEPHVVKIINFQFPVRFEKFFSFLSIFSFVFLVSVEVLSFERAVVLIPISVIPVISVIPMLMLALASILLLVLLLGRVSFSEKRRHKR